MYGDGFTYTKHARTVLSVVVQLFINICGMDMAGPPRVETVDNPVSIVSSYSAPCAILSVSAQHVLPRTPSRHTEINTALACLLASPIPDSLV